MLPGLIHLKSKISDALQCACLAGMKEMYNIPHECLMQMLDVVMNALKGDGEKYLAYRDHQSMI